MLINGIDLSSLGIKLYNRVINSNQVDTIEEWLDGDIQPTSIRQQDRFKDIQVEFLVLSADEEEAFLRISKLTQMLKKATLQFDDLNLTFDVSLNGANKPTRLKNGNFIVSYDLTSNYAKGSREIYTTNANMTNSFKLTVLYYQNSTTLLTTESITIRASAFEGVGDTLDKIGVNVNKYLPQYYNNGVATNLAGIDLTYENLQTLNALIINYAPISYNLTASYFMNNGTGYYNEILSNTITFTQPKIQKLTSIGQLIDAKTYKPEGYKATINYNGGLTVESLLLASPIYVYYDKLDTELSKNITINFSTEKDDGTYQVIQTSVLNVRESDFIDGMTLADFININSFKPTGVYYTNGSLVEHGINQLISYDTIETLYNVRYARAENTLFVEYYVGTYPNWYRLTTATLKTKYKDSFETSFDVIEDLGIDMDRYHTSEYEEGVLYNYDTYDTYEDTLNAGVLQVYYSEIDYPLVVRYYVGDTLATPTEVEMTINALMFLNNPVLGDIIPITAHRPEGYQFNPLLSYGGEITLSALTQTSPINIVYEEIVELKTKNVILKYKKELSSAYSTINTSLITINEADCVGGIRLKDIINLNIYKPDYYENGIIDGYSSTALLEFEQLQSSYNILYVASEYTTPVRYYTDDVDDLNWVGSAVISYRVIDFEVGTTLYDLGLNLNAFKPAYCGNGELQYTGPVNFTALLELDSINVLYWTEVEPEDPSDLDYPHRFLFLQHNDLGDYEHLHPEWTLNHAFINTGVSALDMSKLTVIMECERVDEYVPLHDVNAGYGYLFGSSSPVGEFYMRFNNQTKYGTNLSGVNTYEAKAGNTTNMLTLSEDSAVGFGSNAGIYSSAQQGYSNVIFTYTNRLQSENSQMPYPLYLFANNKSGSYANGLGGIGIYSCRIYYNDVLIRNMIPVQFYDKIGDQVAPSNCLYDKVSQTFFEDGTQLNSFNIKDDDRYPDANLEHKIGFCYVNYYKNDTLFQTSTIWFRGNEFGEGLTWDPYEKFMVDDYQPSYYSPGVIQEMIDGFTVSFNDLNDQIFNVVYTEQNNSISVSYIKEDADGVRTELAEDVIFLTEKDFYQVPTFGDLVRLNKYKPDGYETDFEYKGKRVSLARVLDLSPYEIVYKPIVGDIETYTTVIRYMKKVWGLRNYEVVGTTALTFDQSNFRDGEYIDFHINMNQYKPANYYKDGLPYEWFEKDERLTEPTDLKALYTVYYLPEDQYVDVNYYTDDIDEANLIASTSWEFAIDSYEYPIQLADTLPNEYLNKFKPVGCAGGVLEHPSIWYQFEDLVALNEIAISYESIEEPSDPEDASYEQKVLYWGDDTYTANSIISRLEAVAGKIPYIDLGYKPKEIGRLRVEAKVHCVGLGYNQQELTPNSGGSMQNYGAMSYDYLPFFGYYATEELPVNSRTPWGDSFITPLGDNMDSNEYSKFSRTSKGAFMLRPRLPVATGWVQSAEGPQYFDGSLWYNATSGNGIIAGNPGMNYTGIMGCYRNGVNKALDDDYELTNAYNEYGISSKIAVANNGAGWPASLVRTGEMGEELPTATSVPLGNPYSITLDAYNNYAEIYNENTTNSPYRINFENTDFDFFEGREQPRGSLSLFQATNPTTGKVNIMAFTPSLYPNVKPIGTNNQLQGAAIGSPYGAGSGYGSITIETLVGTGTDAAGNVIYETVSQTKNLNYAKFPMPQYPQMSGCYIWGMKIYDQDRLVRHLIPVAEGDVIFDYTMPANGLFDLITEIFFGNNNKGGKYELEGSFVGTSGLGVAKLTKTIAANEVLPLKVMLDPLIYGKITNNYYDYDNSFIDNQFANVPTWMDANNDPIENILGFNDFKPDDFHLDGMIDLDADLSFERLTLKEIYDMGAANIYYKLKTFTKTIVYYQSDFRVGSKDLFFSLEDIKNASTMSDLDIDVDLYWTEEFAHGRIVFDESIIQSDNIQAFIDAPSPIVVYDKLSAAVAPDIFYQEYYRGGAYETDLITIDEDNPNYLDCTMDGVVLNPNGAIKYYNHYHDALYEDEVFKYFIPYQVRVINKYSGIHRGPARRYQTLAMIVERDTYTIIEERNGWGRLKEYPIGWIMLNATLPITGPGQNPDYDVADSEVATIPFGSSVSITKLTIDRLWCYIADVESWVKAEDISFNQAGKLYNALDIKVVHLDEINFSNLGSNPTLASIGIYPQAKVLRFHQYSDYEYDGEFTYAAFSALHELEFVYPETIYNYTCVYYQDSKAEDNELGRAAFSCTISDWNPDWDTFISNSWKVDEDNNPINPTLYRSTELTLTWDYFGFERNLYKPNGYGNGIYLWNPRTWEDDEIHFTFNELIRCGTQYVVYPIFDPKTYKVWIQKNNLCSPFYVNNIIMNAVNPGIALRLGNDTLNYFYTSPTADDNNKRFDINIEAEYIREYGCAYNGTVKTRSELYGFRTPLIHSEPAGTSLLSLNYMYSENKSIDITLNNHSGYPCEQLTVASPGDKFKINISNYRNNAPLYVVGIKPKGNNDYNYYYMNKISGVFPAMGKLEAISETVDLTKVESYIPSSNKSISMSGTKPTVINDRTISGWNLGIVPYIPSNTSWGTFYGIQSYDQFMMIHYWVPVPKGLWYRYNGETLRIPDNGMFDLLTGEFACSYRFTDPPVKYKVGTDNYGTFNTTIEGKDLIFYRDQELQEENAFNYFDSWEYETSDAGYITQINTAANTYVQPDIYATKVREFASGLIVPVSKYTSDADNKVVGEWYFSSGQWFNTTNASIFAGEFDKLKLTKLQQQVCLVNNATNSMVFYTYLNPAAVESNGEASSYSYGTTASVLTTYYYYESDIGKFYFDGAFWIPESYTSKNTTEHNKNYAAVRDTVFYSVPIADEGYKKGIYLYGERIAVPYVSTNNPNWAFTGQGWIQLANNTSEVV